ncbi:acyltransferase family protein [Aliarcobacter butzleri]|uniref:acyltransferase family protein n=1 Tax=Aliarcobacter butzleri TaxID=28197 RepID=UPI001EDC2716|nr:acyltransferase [Aliarcobacter butzleri]MCG3686178.1 acyltransferase [Aliarcobacter butzleri]
MYSSLQIGRAFAAVLVLLFHLGGIMSSERYFGISEFYIPFSFGSSGVEFFFVLSGFIIYNAHKNDLSQPSKIYSYIKKRFIRIFPTYWIVFIIVYILALFSSSSDVLPKDIVIIVKSLLLFPQDVNIVGGTGAPVVAVAWSLQYEIIFYIFFAFLILNKFTFFIFLLLFLFLQITYYGIISPFPINFFLSHYIILFFMGIIVSKISEYSLKSIFIKYIGFIGFTLYIVTAFDTMLQYDLLKEYRIICYGIASSLIILFIVRIEIEGYNFKKFKKLNLLGNASYSLYLLHYPIMVVIAKIFVILDLVSYEISTAIIAFLIIFFICIIVSIIFHLKIEIPIIKFFKSKIL